MVSERTRRRIDTFLDEADEAATRGEWQSVAEKARAVLAMDPDNKDAPPLLRAAEANLGTAPATSEATAAPRAPTVEHPSSFVAGRYAVRRFLGEGGKKRVYLAHDERLDRDVAFAVIKTDGLDEVGRERITREAQAMGRMGAHPHIVGIYEIGEEAGAPYVVTELLAGGDVEGALAAEGDALPLARTLEIAKGVARGLAFAHSQGVVHRDLKPGNVWLTSSGPNGVAKIGDFGLAVALDRSRLTTHGLMVGTVAYMPPEQALGGEVTPQADLYSLGAMLYELVTGKPPFAGDSPTAIISQHINTPPVAPSWHSEHCPPDLEALILKLLAKVPADRPSSATEVLEALERVDPEGRSASHSDSSANPLDRLARGVFVGRERELERLRATFDDAFAGRGSVVMLVGEPGIGKTRTVLELETYARMRGAKTLWGRSHEAGGAPPFWPWVQIGRAWRDETPDLEASEALRPYAIELQRIFPALRERFPGLPEPPSLDSEEAQFRLFDAFASFLRSVSAETPLVLVLDDLHWADRATLQLLAHVARELGRARLLIVGTYRDTDLDRRHPLLQALAQLNRERLFQRIPLRGLGAPEVGEYVRRSAGVEPGRELVARLHEETEGNAFFLSEVVSLLTQEGTLESRSLSDVAIPEGVKEALGRRLDRLSEDANALLSLAAVLGRDFDHDQLLAVSDLPDADVLRFVEEALAARVIGEGDRPGAYRFTHALMRETLLDELSAARRVRLHAQIAQALEALYGDDADAHAAELAYHCGEAESVLGPEKLVHYALVAGQHALVAAAWSEADELFQRGLEAHGRDRADTIAAQLLLGSARARQAMSSDQRRVPGIWADLQRAFAIFDAAGDIPNAIAAADHEIPASRPVVGLSEMSGRALQLVTPGTREEARILARHGYDRAVVDGDYDAGWPVLERALTVATRIGDESLQSSIRGRMIAALALHMDWQRCVDAARAELSHSGWTSGAGTFGLYWGSVAARVVGSAADAQRLIDATLTAASRNRMPAFLNTAHTNQTSLALSLGDWSRARSSIEAMSELDPNNTRAELSAAVLAALLGQFAAAREHLATAVGYQPLLPPVTAFWGVGFALCALLGADDKGADRYVEEGMPRLLEIAEARHTKFGCHLALALSALARRDAKEAERHYEPLTAPACRFYDFFVSIDRVLGRIAQLSGRTAGAVRHFEEAIEFCRRAGYRPDLAWSLFDLGHALSTAESEGDRGRGLRCLDESLQLATALEMRPLTEKIIATRGLLGA